MCSRGILAAEVVPNCGLSSHFIYGSITFSCSIYCPKISLQTNGFSWKKFKKGKLASYILLLPIHPRKK